MRIEVTEEDIKKSRRLLARKNPLPQLESCCPVAVALRRQGYPDALVCSPDFQLHGASSPPTRQSATVQRFIHTFDKQGEMGPFRFNLPRGTDGV
jgi:hypothetical protein